MSSKSELELRIAFCSTGTVMLAQVVKPRFNIDNAVSLIPLERKDPLFCP